MRAPSASASAQSPALLARIEEKKAELENLKELRDLSGAVASQMEALEQKLSTLSDGTEGTHACSSESQDGGTLTQLFNSDCDRYWQLA